MPLLGGMSDCILSEADLKDNVVLVLATRCHYQRGVHLTVSETDLKDNVVLLLGTRCHYWGGTSDLGVSAFFHMSNSPGVVVLSTTRFD